MTDPQETSADIRTAAHSGGDADPVGEREPAAQVGSDVGGPDSTGQSATEDALTGTNTVGADDSAQDQASNPF